MSRVSLVRLRRPVVSSFLQSRSFCTSRACRDLVGPPDPISNLRPVIYDDAPLSPPTSHPYSLKEFTGDTREYQWKVQRQELDSMNHQFWADVRRLCLFDIHLTFMTEHRATCASTPHSRLIWPLCLNLLQHTTKKLLFRTFMVLGLLKSSIGNRATMLTGAVGIGIAFFWKHESSTRSFWSGSALGALEEY